MSDKPELAENTLGVSHDAGETNGKQAPFLTLRSPDSNLKGAVRRIIAKLIGQTPEERRHSAATEYEKLCAAHYEYEKVLDELKPEIEAARKKLTDLYKRKMALEEASIQISTAKTISVKRWQAEGVSLGKVEDELNARYNYVPRDHPNRHQILQARAAQGVAPPNYDPKTEQENYEKLQQKARSLYQQTNGQLSIIMTELGVSRQLAIELCQRSIRQTGENSG